MKTIGLVGGSGWVSTADYYRIINQEVNKRLGGNHFARIVLYSVNFNDIYELASTGNFGAMYGLVADGARRVIAAGADCVLLCANTWHMFARELRQEIDVPLIHIGEAACSAVVGQGLVKVALLGTRPTMEQDFIKGIFESNGVEVMIPDGEVRDYIHSSIVNELVKEIFLPGTRLKFIDLISDLQQAGAQGIILGCTEIPLLIRQEDISIPAFDTVRIHSLVAADFALS